MVALPAIPPESLWLFTLSGVLLNLTPGADVLFATASGIRGGPRIGALAGLGVGFGALWHVSLAAAGISALLAASPAALTALRWGGGAYLLFLAWKSWHAQPEANGGRGAGSGWGALRRGFLTNVLNPKPVLFVLAFLPQFTDPALGPVWQQIVELGAIFALTGTLITMGYGTLAGLVRQRLARRLGVLNKVAAVVFAGLALRLVVD
ncbi:amino acid transporter [Defluviimonas sp. 20V17]|uniref:Threonine transporter RhtB n=1 Tax=Allgaiera indica TaxID=765699 RepID=A0AAN4UPL7_9RHOB|nr:LysE family translocator [Allgaiera indica]KDB03746.1 amino acid transporter [Defluviimonas sp. 20V17]GHD99905.1 threonine transporter RhtB [Allgaiera indica]SDW40941.1 Threonine/homoserine/homoserine lactone efflux protein [Allgaiera indica]